MTALPPSFVELALPAVTAAYAAAGIPAPSASAEGGTPEAADPHRAIGTMLAAVRAHLGMQVAFVCEFLETSRAFRYVDAEPDHIMTFIGGEEELASSFCAGVIGGRFPPVVPDAAQLPVGAGLAGISARAGSMISVPVTFSDGRVYGTVGCVGDRPDPSLRDRDAGLVALFAELIGRHLETFESSRRDNLDCRGRVQAVLDGDEISVVFQPIVDLTTRRPCGFEALARFPADSGRSPGEWFDDAAAVGLGTQLEVAAIRAALAKIDLLPADTFLAVNVSAATLASRELVDLLRTVDLDRIVIELTERAESDDYVGLMNSLFALRQGGARLAVDDTGAGFDGLRHILQIGPDIIKLDLGVTRGVGSDPVRQAMAYALHRFATSTGAMLVAEGIETSADLDALVAFGVTYGQGYYLGRPAALADIPHPAASLD